MKCCEYALCFGHWNYVKIPNVKIPNSGFSGKQRCLFPSSSLLPFSPPPAKLGEGEEAFWPSPSLAREGGRGDASSRNTIHSINTTVIWDFYIRDCSLREKFMAPFHCLVMQQSFASWNSEWKLVSDLHLFDIIKVSFENYCDSSIVIS